MTDSRISVERSAPGQLPGESAPASQASNSVEWEQKQEPAEYYRAAAARARALEQDATTPRVKQHLRELISRYDRLAGEVERTAENEPGRNPGRGR
ncbi:MAG TPA: hypothetical protein VGM07_19615 [Stellaceae bacterium]|jgi:hypothetical protein